jgi:hypothetical protein
MRTSWKHTIVMTVAVLGWETTGAQQPPSKAVHFSDARTCQKCHVDQHREWSGSAKSYSAASPVFQAMELSVRKLTGKFGPHDSANPTFCINCHSPTAAYGNEMIGLLRHEASQKTMSDVAHEGISCTVCHSVRKPAMTDIPEKGFLGSSLSNADFIFFPTKQLVGPTVSDPLPEGNEFHSYGFSTQKRSSEYLSSEKFCGACHNVNLPEFPDTVTGTPYQVEQGTFTEWENSSYNSTNNRYGKPVSCADCHMSLFASWDPLAKKRRGPGEYPQNPVAKGFARVRKHAIHQFTSASRVLFEESERFPNQDKKENDAFGIPLGQEQRRQEFLKAACTIQIKNDKAKIENPHGTFPLEVVVTNENAGHHVPTGLSQEREVWLEVIGRTEDGKVVLHSGALSESLLGDESYSLSPETLEVRGKKMGNDFNLRPFAAWGVPKFTNAFMRKKSDNDYERVHFLTHANHADGRRSLPPLKPVTMRYDIPVDRLLTKPGIFCGKVRWEAKLWYRSFSPKLLRALSEREPELLGPKEIGRNTAVEMATAVGEHTVCSPLATKQVPKVWKDLQAFSFHQKGVKWIAYYAPQTWETAVNTCQKNACALASLAEYRELGLEKYEPQPGDNHDELWKARWSSDREGDFASTYVFAPLAERVSKVRVGVASLATHPYFCRCASPGEKP